MPELSRNLIEHRLPVKRRFRHHKQHVHRFNPIMYDGIQYEINWLLEAEFIHHFDYVKWAFNIVPIENKESGLRSHIQYRTLNHEIVFMGF